MSVLVKSNPLILRDISNQLLLISVILVMVAIENVCVCISECVHICVFFPSFGFAGVRVFISCASVG